jgi:hypothetical protein
MVVLRRLLLIVITLAVPVVLTAALYAATIYLLHATDRTVDPKVLYYSAIGEFAVFLFLMILDARSRW